MTWTPGPRPAWVDDLHAIGDPRQLVPLDPDGLLSAATTATGLEDFGGTSWRAGFDRLLGAVDESADLHLVGRLLLRSELVRCLVNRLQIEATLQREPSIRAEDVGAPVVVTGTGRSGTSILHELLAQDPAVRAPRTWEVLYPCPPPATETYDANPRIDAAHRDVTLWEKVVPEYRTMHENGGAVPQECIFITAHEFASDYWAGNQWVPSYSRWLATTDLVPAYEYHRTFLQLLQWRCPGERWVLKAPSHLSALPALFAVYPDARVVVTHRDPLRVIGSLTSLSCTLRWLRSDHVAADRIEAQTTTGLAYLLDQLGRWRDDGVVPDHQFIDVRYADLVAEPIPTIRAVYDQLGIELRAEAAARMEAYLAAKPKDRHGAHAYRGADEPELRARFADYQARFDVPDEL